MIRRIGVNLLQTVKLNNKLHKFFVYYPYTIISKLTLSSMSEASASDLLENLEDYMVGYVGQ